MGEKKSWFGVPAEFPGARADAKLAADDRVLVAVEFAGRDGLRAKQAGSRHAQQALFDLSRARQDGAVAGREGLADTNRTAGKRRGWGIGATSGVAGAD